MADIDAHLVETKNGAAPQHKIQGKNKFEASEGSDGAPHNKIVDENGEPIDLKKYLESIQDTHGEIMDAFKLIVQSLIQTNSKLDSVIDDGNLNTQLNGSNVELAKVENFKIPAGSSYEVLFETHTYIGVGITTLELYFGFLKEENIKVDLDHYISGDRYALIKKEIKIIEGENIQRDVIRTKAYGDGWRVRMFNLSNEEVEFFLFGVRGLFI